MSDEKGVLGALLLLFICVFVYFIPSIHGKNRRHPNLQSIVLLNIFLGWTLIGWVVALVWSASAIPPVEQIRIKITDEPKPDRYQQLEKLGSLKERGLISEDEYQAEKTRLLRS